MKKNKAFLYVTPSLSVYGIMPRAFFCASGTINDLSEDDTTLGGLFEAE